MKGSSKSYRATYIRLLLSIKQVCGLHFYFIVQPYEALEEEINFQERWCKMGHLERVARPLEAFVFDSVEDASQG